jgi:hypothetical protein
MFKLELEEWCSRNVIRPGLRFGHVAYSSWSGPCDLPVNLGMTRRAVSRDVLYRDFQLHELCITSPRILNFCNIVSIVCFILHSPIPNSGVSRSLTQNALS